MRNILKEMRNILKENPSIILNTLEALWVILLSIVGNYVMSLKINFCWAIDWVSIFKLISLALCVLFWGITYIRFRDSYNRAEKKENYGETNGKHNRDRKKIDHFLWRIFDSKDFLYLIGGIVFLVLFLILNSFDNV